MRLCLLAATLICCCLTGIHGIDNAAAQTGPLDPTTLDPGVTAAITQYAQSAGYLYAGDCHVTGATGTAAVCSLVFAQTDGSLLAGFYVLGEDGALAVQPFDAVLLTPAPPVVIPPARLVIPSINVDAPVIVLGVDPQTNTLSSPPTKDLVGYYGFTPVPGYGGNTVVAGHVDWYTGETGVFWDLKRLAPGDSIQLVMPDGTVYTYTVTDTALYDNDAAPVDDILGDTPVESITLITCEGVFDPTAAEYDKRRVVRGVRVAP